MPLPVYRLPWRHKSHICPHSLPYTLCCFNAYFLGDQQPDLDQLYHTSFQLWVPNSVQSR